MFEKTPLTAVVGLLLLFFKFTVFGGGTAGILLGFASGNAIEQQRIIGEMDSAAAVMAANAVKPSAIFRIDENAVFGQPDIEEVFSQTQALTPETTLIFIYGHAQKNRAGKILLRMPKATFPAEKLREYIASLPGESIVFCFNSQSLELAELLAPSAAVCVGMDTAPVPDAPPVIPEAFITLWRNRGNGGELFSLLKQSMTEAQKRAAAKKIFFNESPVAYIKGDPVFFPFESCSPMPLLSASNQPEKTAAASSNAETPPAKTTNTACDAVILERDYKVTISGSRAVIEDHRKISVITSAGAESLSSLALPESAEILAVSRRSADGAPREAVGQPERRRLLFPGLAPGDRIEYAISIETKTTDGNTFAIHPEYPLTLDFPQERLNFVLSVPSQTPLRCRESGGTAAESAIEHQRYNTEYRYTFKNVGAMPNVPFLPPERRGGLRILVAQAPDWPTFATDYLNLIAGSGDSGPETERRGAELTAGLDSPEKRLEALYNYVNALKYDATPIGIRALLPRRPEVVIATGVGDCKDKANLLAALAASVGIKAELALLNRGANLDPAFPAWQFNHMIVRIPPCREWPGGMWLDPTDPDTPWGALPPGDAGRPALILNRDNPVILAVRAANAEQNLLRHVWTESPDKTTRLEIQCSGWFAYHLRNQWKRIPADVRSYEYQRQLDSLRPNAQLLNIEKNGDTLIMPADVADAGRFRLAPEFAAAFLAPDRLEPLQLFDGQPGKYVLSIPSDTAANWRQKTAGLTASLENYDGTTELTIDYDGSTINAEDYKKCKNLLRHAELKFNEIQQESQRND